MILLLCIGAAWHCLSAGPRTAAAAPDAPAGRKPAGFIQPGLLATDAGFEIANAAEIMRSWRGWGDADFGRFKTMILDVFYPMNRDFLLHHNGAKIDHYWCNWDAVNMASMLAIGVLCDRRDIYDDAVTY